jgi:hypothetical protein
VCFHSAKAQQFLSSPCRSLTRGTSDRTNKAYDQRDEKREESVTERNVMAWVLAVAQHACKIGHANASAHIPALTEALNLFPFTYNKAIKDREEKIAICHSGQMFGVFHFNLNLLLVIFDIQVICSGR